jgi:hypothetical protein
MSVIPTFAANSRPDERSDQRYRDRAVRRARVRKTSTSSCLEPILFSCSEEGRKQFLTINTPEMLIEQRVINDSRHMCDG